MFHSLLFLYLPPLFIKKRRNTKKVHVWEEMVYVLFCILQILIKRERNKTEKEQGDCIPASLTGWRGRWLLKRSDKMPIQRCAFASKCSLQCLRVKKSSMSRILTLMQWKTEEEQIWAKGLNCFRPRDLIVEWIWAKSHIYIIFIKGSNI